MSDSISIIDKDGISTGNSSDLYFNYLRNSYGFRRFLLGNFGVDIREPPFFSVGNKNTYPSNSEKEEMLTITLRVLKEMMSKKTLHWYFKDRDELEFHLSSKHFSISRKIERSPELYLNINHLDDGRWTVEIPKISIDDSLSYMLDQKYRDWILGFVRLIKDLCKKDHGYNVWC